MVSVQYNTVTMSVIFTEEMTDLTSMTLLVNGKLYPLEIIKANNTEVKFIMQLKESSPLIVVNFGSSIQGKLSDLPVSVEKSTNSLKLASFYYFSDAEKETLKKLQNTVPALWDSAIYGRSVMIFVGLLALVASVINFLQLVTYYLFLSAKLPENLRQILMTLYNSM